MLRARIGGGQVQDDADLAILTEGPVTLHRRGMSQHGVIGHGGGAAKIHHVRIVEVVEVAPLHRHDRLVEGEPVLDLVTEQPEAGVGEVGVSGDHLPTLPATQRLHAHRHVEVEQADEGLYPLGLELVEHGVVEGDGLWVGLSPASRDQPGPGDGGAEAVVTKLLQQTDVIAKMLIKT
ncbi:hypothetical protein D3C85_956510 [compost metagenome]